MRDPMCSGPQQPNSRIPSGPIVGLFIPRLRIPGLRSAPSRLLASVIKQASGEFPSKTTHAGNASAHVARMEQRGMRDPMRSGPQQPNSRIPSGPIVVLFIPYLRIPGFRSAPSRLLATRYSLKGKINACNKALGGVGCVFN
jgi:hypothetical protein